MERAQVFDGLANRMLKNVTLDVSSLNDDCALVEQLIMQYRSGLDLVRVDSKLVNGRIKTVIWNFSKLSL